VSSEKHHFLRDLGVYGYDHVEPVILAALVTGDPLLLIGKAGTGKTFLLNSLSEALGLEHRHYNASLIAFDDLVGFPYPEKDGEGIRYIETPATVWQAQSVLIDEISRCKPEHQNRLFSLVHERRIQGIGLPNLRYRWAAMNPSSTDQGVDDFYEGSVPLDQALADRFAFVTEVPDWDELEESDRKLVADPAGEGALSEDGGKLAKFIEESTKALGRAQAAHRKSVIDYAAAAATALGQNRVRISPRRARQLARNLLGLTAVNEGRVTSGLFRLGLENSLPHRAWGVAPKRETIRAAHKLAWDHAFLSGDEQWLNGVLLESRLDAKIAKILKESPDEDTGAIAVSRILAAAGPVDQAIFAFSLYPAALEGHAKIGAEGIATLSNTAHSILDVNGEVSWQERASESGTNHPDLAECARVLSKKRGGRKERASQFFSYLVANGISVGDPELIEKELNRCILKVRSITK
jgi:MoxR-like ATPase